MKDVFRQALYSYWQGDKSTPYIIRREDGYVSKSSLKEYFATWLEPMEAAAIREAPKDDLRVLLSPYSSIHPK